MCTCIFGQLELDGVSCFLFRRQKHAASLFFAYNTQLGPPYHVLVDTNFINFSIKNKLDMCRAMMDCLLAKGERYRSVFRASGRLKSSSQIYLIRRAVSCLVDQLNLGKSASLVMLVPSGASFTVHVNQAIISTRLVCSQPPHA